MSAPTDDGMSYASYCPDCGRMVAAIVDSPDRKRDVAKHVAQSMREGCRVERIPCQAVREGAWGCSEDCACKWCEKRRRSSRKAQLEKPDAAQEAFL